MFRKPKSYLAVWYSYRDLLRQDLSKQIDMKKFLQSISNDKAVLLIYLNSMHKNIYWS